MKPLWVQTLAWVLAIVIATLFALATPDHQGMGSPFELLPHGSTAPR